ncbi:MAG: hypothetical protein M3P37_02455, partial [Actinomycetota bacterium]|nr:hypothetical protein [Actinomycetota bacterium]
AFFYKRPDLFAVLVAPEEVDLVYDQHDLLAPVADKLQVPALGEFAPRPKPSRSDNTANCTRSSSPAGAS